MSDTFWVSQWALIRRGELVDIPEKLEIHPDFLQKLSPEEFEGAFREAGAVFRQMYADMAEEPEKFGFPLYLMSEYDYFSNQARESRKAPWYPGHFLLVLFALGNFQGMEFLADTAEVRRVNQAKKTNLLLKALCEYGFGGGVDHGKELLQTKQSLFVIFDVVLYIFASLLKDSMALRFQFFFVRLYAAGIFCVQFAVCL